MQQRSCASATCISQWVVPNFAGFTETLESPTFEIGGYSWWVRGVQALLSSRHWNRQGTRVASVPGNYTPTAPLPLTLCRSSWPIPCPSTRRLRFFPKSTDSTDKEGHVSLFLNQVAATCPSERQHYPDTIFALKVKNFKDRKLDHADCKGIVYGHANCNGTRAVQQWPELNCVLTLPAFQVPTTHLV